MIFQFILTRVISYTIFIYLIMANCFIDKYMSNMKFNIQKLTLIKLLLTLFLLIPVHANDLYYTRSGMVSFFSSRLLISSGKLRSIQARPKVVFEL